MLVVPLPMIASMPVRLFQSDHKICEAAPHDIVAGAAVQGVVAAAEPVQERVVAIPAAYVVAAYAAAERVVAGGPDDHIIAASAVDLDDPVQNHIGEVQGLAVRLAPTWVLR